MKSKLIFLFGLLCASVAAAPPYLTLMSAKGRLSLVASSGYDPSTDAKVVQWLKADAITPQSDNTALATWTASTGNNATQGTGINQPAYRTAGGAANKNGKAVVEFFSTANPIFMTTTTFGTLSQPFTVFIVYKYSSNASYYFAFDGRTGSTNRAYFYSDPAPAWTMGTDGSGDSFGTPDTNWHVAECFYNTSSSSLTLDGGSPHTLAGVGAGTFIGITLASDDGATTEGHITIAEVIVLNAAPTSASAIFAYLNARWAVY